jgi:signal transduction histidine kinase
MRQPPIRIRTFILGTVLVLLLVPSVGAGSAWLIERDRQQVDLQGRLDTAGAYLSSHRTEMQEPDSVQGFARLLGRLDLLAQLIIARPGEKRQLYLSEALSPAVQKQQAARQAKAGRPDATATSVPDGTTSWIDHGRRVIPAGTRKAPATFVLDLYHRPASRATRALVALVSGIAVLLVGLAVAIWLVGRWMVAPLARLSMEVDRVAGGDLTIAVPRSRIGEIANIAQAVEGMTAALDETAQRRAEADEARRFLITSVAHDLRTPLFALRGHLQAIGARLGNPDVHLERAEARADALERLVGNLFAYTRDDYAQPAPQLEAAQVDDLLQEVSAGLEHTARLRDITFALDGDHELEVIVDRDRFKRALTNILDNALRYSPPGATVHLSCTSTDRSTVQISVHDHGAGIDSNLLPHIFEAGIRGASAAGSADGGAGLGLTIAKRLLEHQHATLTARNQPTGGAVISVTLQRVPRSSS